MCKKGISLLVLLFLCFALYSQQLSVSEIIQQIRTELTALKQELVASKNGLELSLANQEKLQSKIRLLEISLQESEKSYQTVLEQYKTSETQQIELQMEYKLVLKDLEELSNELVSLKKDYQNLIKSSVKKDGIITLQKVFLVIESILVAIGIGAVVIIILL